MIGQRQDLVFEHLLVTTAGWLLLLCGAWTLLLGMAALVEAATSGRLRATAWVGCPPRVRRVLLAALGVSLVAAPAQAVAGAGTPSGAPAGCAPPGTRVAAARTLPVPSRATGGLGVRPTGTAIAVRVGDSLWGLASARLPASAGPAEIADLVEQLHRRNRSAIGPDPDLLRPGQRLLVPRRPRTHPATLEETP